MEFSSGHDVLPLFSSPVYIKNLELFQSADELMALNKHVTGDSITWVPNHDNLVTDENRWLETIKDKKLYSLIYNSIHEYFYGMMQASPDIKIEITDSWLNKSIPGAQHHRHRHSNSIISGVYYFDVSEDSGSLIFSKSHYPTIEFDTINSNIYNSKHWIINPKRHTLILFPSEVEHKVSVNKSNINRISLAFNTFIKGPISKSYLQSLDL